MADAIGALLPLALGIAISPIPIIAAILMLLSPRAGATSIGFLLGWLVGIIVGCTVFVLLASATDMGSAEGPSTAASWIKLVLGLLLAAFAVQQWRSRPKPGESAALPGWMQSIDTLTTAKASALGFLLAAVNPKNLGLCIAAGVEIGGGDLSSGEVVLAVAVFTVISGVSVAVPVIGYQAVGARLDRPLTDLRGWLLDNNTAVMSVLLAVIGVTLIGKGIGGLG